MTSIELLIEQITLEYKKHLPDWEFPNKEHYVEMHKQEILDAHYQGQEYGLFDGDSLKYYQETFKKD